MFIARLFISCLFLLSISLQGMAAVQLAQPCPMEQTMMQADMDDRCSMMSAMPQNDCCLDGESNTHSGPVCKPGQECHAGQLSIMNTAPAVSFQAANPATPHFSDPLYLPLALSTIWRPPLALSH